MSVSAKLEEVSYPALSKMAASATPAKTAKISAMDATPDIHERVQSRRSLHQRFEGRLSVDPMVTHKLVSYQGNYGVPGFRWMRYKEGFSRDLVHLLIQRVRPSSLLDPFSGIGTAPLVASGYGIKATGIELIPVGLLVAQAISRAANTLEIKLFAKAAAGLLDHISSNSQIDAGHAFPHVDITGRAFPSETESDLARAREFISEMKDRDTTIMLNLACMSVLESVSFTQKDGQFLRWDRRSGKSRSSTFQKKSILRLKDALDCRLGVMLQDLGYVQERYGKGVSDFIAGSSLDHLKRFPSDSYDMVITSPPYLNRYDYTRFC